MKIGVPVETFAGEQRVATTPEVAAQLMKLIDVLEDLDDVQSVTANLELADALII